MKKGIVLAVSAVLVASACTKVDSVVAGHGHWAPSCAEFQSKAYSVCEELLGQDTWSYIPGGYTGGTVYPDGHAEYHATCYQLTGEFYTIILCQDGFGDILEGN